MQPSKLQQAIIDYVTHEKGNLLIQARAGSGKTSTLVMIADALPRKSTAVFLAFNKAIATELGKRLPSTVDSATFHALGFRAIKPRLQVRGNPVDARKCGAIFEAQFPKSFSEIISPVLRLVSLMKASCLMPESTDDELIAIMSHYGIESESDNFTDADIMQSARIVLRESNNDLTRVDFDDMLYLVYVLDVRISTYDYVMVDESQDTNMIQRYILRKMLHGKSRLIAVGDEAQAIYGFRGADANSMALIRDEFSCTELPLSISYRCPVSVIRQAQAFVPDIEYRDGAPDGTVKSVAKWNMRDFQSTDLLVCRNTAPLVKVAYRMIANRLPCKIMGRDIGQGLISLIQKIGGKHATLDILAVKLEEYRAREVSKAMAKHQESKAQAIADRCESIACLIDGMTQEEVQSQGVAGLVAIITRMFSDNGPQVTTLATVHKSKGMEAQRVFIVDVALMPSKYARQEWQQVQESNLQYVAITRALDSLFYVDSDNVE